MQQYNAVKARYPHALLLFRLGDFYELFYEDAISASRELQITLTSRNREKGQPIPMCGVPYHAADGYIARLIRAGYKVAICEQMEQPGPGKKLVRREVARVITPGTATDVAVLDARENNYLAAVAQNTVAQKIGLALAEEGAVLLKNKAGVLPLSGVKSIAVIGDDAGAEASVQATNSAVPVAGAPKTLSICMPAGNSVGTGTVLDWPPRFTTTSSTATKEVKRVTRR